MNKSLSAKHFSVVSVRTASVQTSLCGHSGLLNRSTHQEGAQRPHGSSAAYIESNPTDKLVHSLLTLISVTQDGQIECMFWCVTGTRDLT